jgi:hypothetical protein
MCALHSEGATLLHNEVVLLFFWCCSVSDVRWRWFWRQLRCAYKSQTQTLR